MSVVGDFDPSLVKTFDFTRAAMRTPFDGNVVYQYETMESVCTHLLFHIFHLSSCARHCTQSTFISVQSLISNLSDMHVGCRY